MAGIGKVLVRQIAVKFSDIPDSLPPTHTVVKLAALHSDFQDVQKRGKGMPEY
jgi:hypothetical protein